MRAGRVRPARFPKTHSLNAAIVAALILVLSTTGFVWADNSVTIVVDGETREIRTQADTVADALARADVPVTSADVVAPGLEEPVVDGDTIVVRHATPVVLHVDGETRAVEVVGETVADALVAAGVDLDQSAAVSPSLDSPLSSGMSIVVPTVFTRVSREAEPVPFETVVKKDKTLPAGTRVVKSEGVEGRVLKVWESVVVDGKPGERTLTASSIVRKPKPRVVVEGTAKPVSKASSPAQSSPAASPSAGAATSSKPAGSSGSSAKAPASGRRLTVSSTAYSPAQPGLNSTTATGRKATKGVIAVDPRVIPLGTRVYIPGYGNAIAADTGGAIKGNKIDVCFDTVAQALAWGRRTVTITILD